MPWRRKLLGVFLFEHSTLVRTVVLNLNAVPS